MVTNNLDEQAVRDQADTLSFPSSVVEYFQGAIGIPYGGFPQPMQKQVVKDLPVFSGRPGAELPPLDLDAALADVTLTESFSDDSLSAQLEQGASGVAARGTKGTPAEVLFSAPVGRLLSPRKSRSFSKSSSNINRNSSSLS